MANVLSLAMKINADASGFKLDPVQRALVSLGEQADKVTAQFDKFATESEAAARVQGQFADQLQALQNALRDGAIGATEFAVEFEKLTAAADAEAKAFEQAAKITEASLTPLQKYQRAVAELDKQLAAGRITPETYANAVDKAKANLDKASDSAGKTDKAVQSLNSNLSLLTKIEIGRTLVDGFQAIGGALQSAVGQITSIASSVNSSLDSLNDLSARTGISVEDFQGFSLAAKLAGVDAAAFGTSIQKLGVEIGKAKPGDGFDKSLKGIGLSVAELRALQPEQQFSAIGEAISQLPTAADRAAAAVEIFGKQGAALAPLFREGAASIDELRLEAEQLGIIVNQTQVDNVAAMNDAFDKVSATVRGIVGQVIGNLAPAVTDVTNQFLEFVKNFNGGQGGTGIANAITDVLLKGAEQLAKVFDYAVEQFNGFSGALESAASTFDAVGGIFFIVGNTFMSAMEGLRVVFNVFELAGNKLMEGLGRFLEGIGSWVDSDLELAGKVLADEAAKSADQNAKQMEEAAANAAKYAQAAAEATVGVFTGNQGSAEAAGSGAATQYIKGMAQRLADSRLPEVKLESNVESLRDQFDTLFNGLVDNSNAAAQSMQEFERALAAAQQDGTLTTEEIAKLEELQRGVNAELDKERKERQRAADAAKNQLAADEKRVEALLKPNDAATKLEEDLAAVIRLQAKAQEELAAARKSNSREAADQSAATLAQLDQQRAKLEDLRDAENLGFGGGFTKAFEDTAKQYEALAASAAKFGEEGRLASQQFLEGITAAQERVKALGKDGYEAEIARQRQLFDQRLSDIAGAAKAAQEFQQAVDAGRAEAATRLDQFLNALDGGRQQRELAAVDAVEKRKKEAAFNVEEIEKRIDEKKEELEQARYKRRLDEARLRNDELKALEKLKRAEQQIVDGKVEANRQVNNVAQANAAAQQSQLQAFSAAAQRQVQATQAAANDAISATNAAFAQAAERQRKIFNDLNTLGSRTVQTADVRTAEGAAIVLGLAANAQDPRLIEQRLANKILKQISTGLVANLNRIGIPAFIPG